MCTYAGVSGEGEGDGADEGALAGAVGAEDEVEAGAWAAGEAVVGHEVGELDLDDVPRHVAAVPAPQLRRRRRRRRRGGDPGALGGARGGGRHGRGIARVLWTETVRLPRKKEAEMEKKSGRGSLLLGRTFYWACRRFWTLALLEGFFWPFWVTSPFLFGISLFHSLLLIELSTSTGYNVFLKFKNGANRLIQ